MSISRTLLGLSTPMIATIVGIAQSTATSTSKASSAESKSSNTLSASEQLLVAGSKNAIIQTGSTAAHFDEHFKLLEVVDKPADRRELMGMCK